VNPGVALKTDANIGKTLSFATIESIHQPMRDIMFSEVRIIIKYGLQVWRSKGLQYFSLGISATMG